MKTKSITTLTTATLVLLAALTLPARAGDVKENWEKNCASCHGKDGKGETKMGKKLDVKDYTDAKVQQAITDEKAKKALKEGIKDDKGKERMKSYADILSDDEIKALIGYVRAFKKP